MLIESKINDANTQELPKNLKTIMMSSQRKGNLSLKTYFYYDVAYSNFGNSFNAMFKKIEFLARLLLIFNLQTI